MIKTTRLGWSGHVARIKEVKNVFKILTGKSTGKMHSGRPRFIWEDNSRMNVKEIGINTRNWVYSAQDRDYFMTSNEVMSLRLK